MILADDSSTFEGTGATISGNLITITNYGVYTVSGSLSNGSILITADDGGEVELDLAGVSITKSGASAFAPIYSVNGDKLKIKKGKSTTNTIVDNRSSYDVTNYEDKAAIFSNKKLSITGSGSLSVASTMSEGNGIQTDTKLEAANGKLSVSAPNNGIKAHDYILLGDASNAGTFTITSTAGDALKVDEDYTSSMEADEFAGVKLANATYTLTAYDDGIDSASNIYLEAGSGSIQATDTKESDNAKGLAATLSVYLDGGTYSITSAANDGINSAANVNINDGTYTISAGTTQDGIHADNELNISGGTTTVSQSSEGFEALYINASGGTTYVKTSDDGWNAAGGSDTTQTGGWGGSTTSSGVTPVITISGGNHYVAAGGDGIDSNGNIVVTGGFTVVSQTGGGNGPIDFGDGSSYSFKQSGGFLAAYGASDMTVTSSGSQYSLLASWSSAVTTSQYLLVANAGMSYAVKPQYASAYSLYISSSSFSAGSVSLGYASALSSGTEIFKGVYSDASATTSAITSGTWSTSSINIGSTSSTEHGSRP